MKAITVLALLFGASSAHKLHHHHAKSPSSHVQGKQNSHKYGVVDEEDTVAYQNQVIDENSNEAEYNADSPVGYNDLQLQYLKAQHSQKEEKKYGVVDEEDT